MSGLTPEGLVKRKIRSCLKAHGAWHCMPQGTVFGQSGVPDFIICHHGFFVAVEAKANAKKKPTPLQQVQLGLIAEHGGIVLVVGDDEGVSRLDDTLTAIEGRTLS